MIPKLILTDIDGVWTDGGMYYDQTGNEWNGAVLFDLGKERSCILAKAQHSGVGNIIFSLTGLEFFLGHIQQNMEQASADTGVGHILALEQIAERR